MIGDKALRKRLEQAGLSGDPAKIFEHAAAVCSVLADHIEATEPYAKNPIRDLREASSVLSGQAGEEEE